METGVCKDASTSASDLCQGDQIRSDLYCSQMFASSLITFLSSWAGLVGLTGGQKLLWGSDYFRTSLLLIQTLHFLVQC